jgi:SOS response regulatory protein OraA/RecX
MMTKTIKTPWVKAMDFLARRDHSEKELIEKLRRTFSDAEIIAVIEEMKERGWLLPPDELSEKVAQQLHDKNKGYLYICHFLRKKGLPMVSKDPQMEEEKARSLVAQKSGDSKSLQKIASLLKNRGFDTETIGKVVHEVRADSPSIY